jgi:glycosyltransferase involved in cell wall biosynthesis
MTEASPRIAVIVPCYNDGATVADALASIDEREPVEVVLVDDGSSDEHTLEVLAGLEAEGVRLVRHATNRGLPEARTTGLGATTAPYVFPLDSDDLAVPGSLARLADALERTPAADAAYGDWVQFGAVDTLCRVPRTFDPYQVAFRNRYPVASMFRRSFLESVAGWRSVDGMVGYEDWDLWMTLAERGGTAVFADTIAVRYRVHGVRMLRSVTGNHRALYTALQDRHPGLFAELPRHRERSTLSRPARALYPILYGARRPTGIRRRGQELTAWLRRALRRTRTGGAPPRSPR